MKLAHFSPLPPQPSGIADYCAALLPALQRRAEVDAYIPSPVATREKLPFLARPMSAFPARRFEYDGYLYHMGNHPAYHREIYDMLCRYPGVVILHEANLHAFFLNQMASAAYVQAMGYSQGLRGVVFARQVLAGRCEPPVEQDGLVGRIARLSLGIIVHSRAAARAVAAQTSTPVTYVPLGVAMPASASTGAPDLLGHLPVGTLILASFGHIAPSKRLEVVLRVLARMRATLPPFRYLLAGQPVPGYDLASVLDELVLRDVVILTGYTEPETFDRLLQRTDVGINLRSAPTGGEMSAALLQMMAAGQPVLVSDVDAFAELPDEAVWKIDQDATEQEQIASALNRLSGDPSLRQRIGERARQYVQDHHAMDETARRYLETVEVCLTGIAAVHSGR
jgi:glycosyltransferase involved in cell wall biosynthesis